MNILDYNRNYTKIKGIEGEGSRRLRDGSRRLGKAQENKRFLTSY